MQMQLYAGCMEVHRPTLPYCREFEEGSNGFHIFAASGQWAWVNNDDATKSISKG